MSFVASPVLLLPAACTVIFSGVFTTSLLAEIYTLELESALVSATFTVMELAATFMRVPSQSPLPSFMAPKSTTAFLARLILISPVILAFGVEATPFELLYTHRRNSESSATSIFPKVNSPVFDVSPLVCKLRALDSTEIWFTVIFPALLVWINALSEQLAVIVSMVTSAPSSTSTRASLSPVKTISEVMCCVPVKTRPVRVLFWASRMTFPTWANTFSSLILKPVCELLPMIWSTGVVTSADKILPAKFPPMPR